MCRLRYRWNPFVLCLALLVVIPFSATPVAAEDPHNRDCAGAPPVALLCAGADAGGTGTCTNDSPSAVTCTYTYGWNLLAESGAELPGEGRLDWSYTVDVCVSGEGCVVHESGGGTKECSWLLPTDECRESGTGAGSLDFVLALGQCVTVTATASASTQAAVTGVDGPLFEAHAQQVSSDGGAACHLDDGR